MCQYRAITTVSSQRRGQHASGRSRREHDARRRVSPLPRPPSSGLRIGYIFSRSKHDRVIRPELLLQTRSRCLGLRDATRGLLTTGNSFDLCQVDCLASPRFNWDSLSSPHLHRACCRLYVFSASSIFLSSANSSAWSTATSTISASVLSLDESAGFARSALQFRPTDFLSAAARSAGLGSLGADGPACLQGLQLRCRQNPRLQSPGRHDWFPPRPSQSRRLDLPPAESHQLTIARFIVVMARTTLSASRAGRGCGRQSGMEFEPPRLSARPADHLFDGPSPARQHGSGHAAARQPRRQPLPRRCQPRQDGPARAAELARGVLGRLTAQVAQDDGTPQPIGEPRHLGIEDLGELATLRGGRLQVPRAVQECGCNTGTRRAARAATRRATRNSHPPTLPLRIEPALRARTMNTAWKASSASCSSRTARRQTPSTIAHAARPEARRRPHRGWSSSAAAIRRRRPPPRARPGGGGRADFPGFPAPDPPCLRLPSTQEVPGRQPTDSNYSFSFFDVWSDVIFQPSSNLRNTSVNRPVAVSPVASEGVHAPDERGGGVERFDLELAERELAHLLALASDTRLMYRSRVASQPLVTVSPDVNVSSSLLPVAVHEAVEVAAVPRRHLSPATRLSRPFRPRLDDPRSNARPIAKRKTPHSTASVASKSTFATQPTANAFLRKRRGSGLPESDMSSARLLRVKGSPRGFTGTLPAATV